MKPVGKLGTAVVDITPESPIPLSGFAGRNQPFSGVHSRLKAKIFAFEDALGEGAMVVCADLLAWDRCFVFEARRILRELFGRQRFGVILNASHTHSAPGALRAALPSLGALGAEYHDFLLRKLRRGFFQAWTAREPATVQLGTSRCTVGVHRRRLIDGEVAMAPDPAGPTDDEVTTVVFRRPSGEALGGWLHYTCHPTTKSDLLVSSEFCGFAVDLLEQSWLEGAPCGFLQGCCGDIRPRIVGPEGDRFRPGTCEDVEAFGRSLADSAEEALSRAGAAEGIWLRFRENSVRLAYQDSPTTAALETLRADFSAAPFRREWAEQMLGRPALRRPFALLKVSGLRISSSLRLLGLSAEPSVAFGLYARSRAPRGLLPLGYTNGLLGYLTTRQQLLEGGYESRRAFHFFGAPAPLAADAEHRVLQEIDEMVGETN